ncbi:SDR family NAD(P)-dependent oxidoreductase [Streptomyces sp. NPDC001822]|uniref:SDR family NAD(P)-dependent oxidoreductase n=1 Tax=Streptomyces sp. NPDC001822 TaxID=3364614 RepID=UPI003685DDAE
MNDQQPELDGRYALVTGASKGIGLAVTTALAEAGAHVLAVARTATPELRALVDRGAVTWVQVDLTAPDGAQQAVAAADGRHVDVLVNNVGSAPARPDGFLSVTDAQWRQTIELNLMTAVSVTRAVLPGMLDAGGGAIINIASVNARLPESVVVDYSASKSAVASLSKALSKEFGGRGVRVNSVSPGPVETELWTGDGGVAATVSQAAGVPADDVKAQAASSTASGRFSRPSEVADLVVYLAGDRARNIMGSDFIIDGGYVPTL